MRTWPAIDVERPGAATDLLQAALIDFDVAAVEERTDECWRVFFASPAERDRALASLSAAFTGSTMVPVDVPDEDWAARSQAALRAIRVGHIIVAPPWDMPEPSPDGPPRGVRPPIVVVIQPSMGFGTGHHATTRLCLAALQQFDLRGRTVLDLGTGSGVLAIAASLLGAERVIAIDDDPDAVASARENATLNRTPIDLRVADLRSLVVSRFDMVLANLTGGLLMASAGRLQDLTTRRGPMIISGFTVAEEAAVAAAFPALRIADRGQEDEWVCLTLQRGGAFE